MELCEGKTLKFELYYSALQKMIIIFRTYFKVKRPAERDVSMRCRDGVIITHRRLCSFLFFLALELHHLHLPFCQLYDGVLHRLAHGDCAFCDRY